MSVCTHTHTQARTQARTKTHPRAHTRAHNTHTDTDTHTQTHAHTHTHTQHTHTRAHTPLADQLRLFPNRLEFDADVYAFDAVDVARDDLGVKKATSPLTLGMIETRCPP